jgi:Protein of unknown function (DUF2637)
VTGARTPPGSPARRRLAAAVDGVPVAVLAAIAGAGSFTHIRDTAAEHGQRGPMAWAVAVCIDLTCVMAARERQRDKRLGITARRLSWPAVVLAGGAGLSLAANLAQAQPTAWGRITAAVPCGAFLVAVSMIERRAARPAPDPVRGAPSPPPDAPDGAVPEAAAPVPAPVPGGVPAADGGGVPSPPGEPPASPPRDVPDETVLAAARRAAAGHLAEHGRPISRDALRARLGVSNQTASDLLRQLRSEAEPAPAAAGHAAGQGGAASARAPPRAPRPCGGTGPRPGRDATVPRGPGAPSGIPVADGYSARPASPGSFPYSRRHWNPRDPENSQPAADVSHSGGLPDCFTGKPVKQLIAPAGLAFR